MALIIIAEFAKNNPGDDIKILYHTNTILDQSSLENLVVSVFMGLFSSSGNDHMEREGSIPLGEKFSFAFSVPSSEVTRLCAIVVPDAEKKDLQKMIIDPAFEEMTKPLKSLLCSDDLPINKIEPLVRRIVTKLNENNEATRISNIFSEEI